MCEEEEEEEEEEGEEEEEAMGGGRRKGKPHHPLMFSVHKVRVRTGKGKGKTDGGFRNPLTYNTRRLYTEDPETKLPVQSLCPTREWVREWWGVTTPNIVSGKGVALFLFGQGLPYLRRQRNWLRRSPWGPLIGSNGSRGHHRGQEPLARARIFEAGAV